MSKAIEAILDSYQRHVTPEQKRAAAVAAALLVIQAKSGNSPTFGNVNESEMHNLSTYADQIEEALKVK